MQYNQDQRCKNKEPFDRYTDTDNWQINFTIKKKKFMVSGRNNYENVKRNDEIECIGGTKAAGANVRRFAQTIQLILKLFMCHDFSPIRSLGKSESVEGR